MPKIPSTPTHVQAQHGPNLNVLKRNQACHQVTTLSRPLHLNAHSVSMNFASVEGGNCDAKRPCSTCIRSHKHAIAHSPAGTVHPHEPECTFDEPLELSTGIDGPRTKYEKLENRIAELEALLQEKNSPSDSRSTLTPQDGSPSSSSPREKDSGFGSESDSRSTGSTPALVNTPLSMNPGSDVSWTHWPAELPGPDLLRHLVDVFFTFHPHASQLFHTSTFMTSLSLPPNHPRFPATPVLHAICAVGSHFTSAVTSPPPVNFDETTAGEIFTQRYRAKENRPDSFAEQQASLAKETAQRMEIIGLELVQVLQTSILLSWYYCSHASWAELFLNCAHSIRLCIPLGLNVCPPFHTISRSTRPASVLTPAKNVVEDELRRNLFWLAYVVERQHGCSNGWALSLDDQDISQLLPVKTDQFEAASLVSPSERQWAHSNDLLTVHPEKQTDSFILYIKSSILLSKVKTFNLRFRAKHFSGEGDGALPYSTFRADEPVDPRNTMAFIDLDRIATSFLATFPAHLRTPIQKNMMDCSLFASMVMAHVATIVLHEPHADLRSRGCISALKILTATRSIIDLIYSAWSTSFDISLFESFVSFCFFAAGRVLARFLHAAIEEDAKDQITTFTSELRVIRDACEQMSQRHRLASSFTRMLDELTAKAEARWEPPALPQQSPSTAHPLVQLTV